MDTLARVTVKIGGITQTSRTTVRIDNPEFLFNPEELYGAFCAQVERIVEPALAAYEARTLRHDMNLYGKPSTGATQRDLIALTEDNWHSVLDQARANHLRRRKANGPLCFEVFVFAVKEARATDATRRRATRGRIQQAAEDISDFLAERTDVHVGEIARTHWTMTQARQPVGAPVALPESATFNQMQHLDAVAATMPALDHEEALHQTLAVWLNGSSELQLTLNVQALRALLGLPSHNMLAQGIFATFQPPPEPTDDIEDVDHQDE